MAEVTITKDNFQAEVLSAQGIVLVDFWAAWCGPCRMLSPVVDEIAAETPHVKVGIIKVEDLCELAGQFRIESIPTLIVFKDGLAVHRLVGVQPKEQILALLS